MSVIVKMFCYFILQVCLLLSVLFLLRGHDYPGGGFIGALIACTGIAFYNLAYKRPPKFIRKKYFLLINTGIGCLLASILMPIFLQKSILTGLWIKLHFLGHTTKLGTPLLFDTGIYLSILGGLSLIITHLESESDD